MKNTQIVIQVAVAIHKMILESRSFSYKSVETAGGGGIVSTSGATNDISFSRAICIDIRFCFSRVPVVCVWQRMFKKTYLIDSRLDHVSN